MSVKSLYGQYIEEREGFEIIETPTGFATFRFSGDECYIRDIFIEKRSRNDNAASKLADRIKGLARAKDAKWLVGTVQPSAKGSTASIKVLLAYGFELASSQPDFIIFKLKL